MLIKVKIIKNDNENIISEKLLKLLKKENVIKSNIKITREQYESLS